MDEKFITSRARIDAHAAGFEAHKKTIDVAGDLASVNDFIFKLCEDPAQVAAFKANPDEVMASAGISPELGGLIKAGQAYVIGKYAGNQFGGLAAGAGGDNTVTVVVVVVVVV